MNINDIDAMAVLVNGAKMPCLGLGVCQLKEGKEVMDAVGWALEAGYRLIDTASIYKNERGVGQAIRRSGRNRKDLFITGKVWNADHGYLKTLDAFEKSIDQLQVDYLDLYLIHWPGSDRFLETWNALETLYLRQKVRSIGVCNCLQHHLEYLMQHALIPPMVNQMEFHPRLVQHALLSFCQSNGICFQGWGPLMKGEVNRITELQTLALRYSKSIPQIVLRWQLQKGILVIPRSARKEHIFLNADLFDFNITDPDMHYIDALNQNKRTYRHPDEFIF